MSAKYLYFAYGSNMSTPRLRERAPSARCLGTARLPGHALRWHKLGRDGSGKCDIAAAGADDCVWGVLFEVAAADKENLDRVEGLGIGYDEKRVRIETEHGKLLAMTYQAKPDKVNAALRPRQWYKAHVLRGAREHGLPAAYVAAIESVPTEP